MVFRMYAYGIKHRFSSLDMLFEAFKNITLRANSKKQWTDASGKKNTSHFTKSRPETNRKETLSPQQVKCYNYNEEGHHSGSCSKPREKGSCFHCGKMDHRVRDCPIKEVRQSSDKPKASTSNTKSGATKDTSGGYCERHNSTCKPIKCQDIESSSPVGICRSPDKGAADRAYQGVLRAIRKRIRKSILYRSVSRLR